MRVWGEITSDKQPCFLCRRSTLLICLCWISIIEVSRQCGTTLESNAALQQTGFFLLNFFTILFLTVADEDGILTLDNGENHLQWHLVFNTSLSLSLCLVTCVDN